MSLSVRIVALTLVGQVLTGVPLLLFRLDHLFLGSSSRLAHLALVADQGLKPHDSEQRTS